MDAPESLFPGVEWERSYRGRTRVCKVGPTMTCEVSPIGTYAKEWEAEFDCSLDHTFTGTLSECLDWLRTKVVETRDELCRLTGTHPHPKPRPFRGTPEHPCEECGQTEKGLRKRQGGESS